MKPITKNPIILYWILLFICYHAAEYRIVFKNDAIGFLFFQVAFFLISFYAGKKYYMEGMKAWGLEFNRQALVHLLKGVSIGCLLYTAFYCIGLILKIESISAPFINENAGSLILLFVFGNFFSSFSEDILTRGILYKTLAHKLNALNFVLLSAIVYVLNHIYRWTSGWESWGYLFALGLVFATGVMITKKLWFTGGMHWAGNCTFYFTHNCLNTKEEVSSVSSNSILMVMCFLLWGILLLYFFYNKIKVSNQTST